MIIELGQTLLLIGLGLVSGMLVNYLSDVLPIKRRLARPFCINCDTVQPIVNYFLVPRRCSNCNSRRCWRTWVVELVFIGFAVWTWHHPAIKLGFLLGWIVLLYFGVVVVIDVEHRLILHPVSLVGAGAGLTIGLIVNGWISTLIGGAVGFVVMLFLFKFGDYLMRSIARIKKQPWDDIALGFGDVNLSGIIGLILGWPLIVYGLVLTAFIGGFVSLIYLIVMLVLRRYQLFTALPYGPYLISAAFLLLFLGEAILKILSH